MSNLVSYSIIVPIDTTPGVNAVNYSIDKDICPIIAIHCVRASGTGSVKITPYRSVESTVDDVGTGARFRIGCDSYGRIINVEIASEGAGYTDGVLPVKLYDPYGTNGQIECVSSGGKIVSVNIISPGINYSGFVTMDVSDFIEGVVYNFIPRYIENTGSGMLKLFGYRYSIKPFQIF